MLDAPGGNRKDAFYCLPLQRTSHIITYGWVVVEAGQRFALIADMQVGVGDGFNQQACSWTTSAYFRTWFNE